MTAPARWKKSSFTAQQANCVEVASTLTALRDSKDRQKPILPADVPALVAAVKDGWIG
jgi:hypothetical protein